MREWYFSSKKMTIWVQSDSSDVICDCAPIARRFIGQKIKNLADWMRKHGDFQYSELKSPYSDAKIELPALNDGSDPGVLVNREGP